MARRLLIALILSLLISIAVYVVLPRYGVVLPAWIPLLAFAAMVAASVAIALENEEENEDHGAEDGLYYPDSPPPDPDDLVRFDDEARPLGCCGPRPVGEASRRFQRGEATGEATGGSCCG